MMDPQVPDPAASPAALAPVVRRLVLHWGEMGARWGVNRTVSQIHALLYLGGRPMPAEAIAEALQVARSNVSMSLRELANWNLVRVVHLLGDRRDHFETERDPWELFRIIVRQRKAREFEPTIAVLRDCLEDPDFARRDPDAQERIRETLALMESLSAWSDEMLGLESATLTRLMKLGARIRNLLHPSVKPRVHVRAPPAPHAG